MAEPSLVRIKVANLGLESLRMGCQPDLLEKLRCYSWTECHRWTACYRWIVGRQMRLHLKDWFHRAQGKVPAVAQGQGLAVE